MFVPNTEPVLMFKVATFVPTVTGEKFTVTSQALPGASIPEQFVVPPNVPSFPENLALLIDKSAVPVERIRNERDKVSPMA
jgi:hypothetical protein